MSIKQTVILVIIAAVIGFCAGLPWTCPDQPPPPVVGWTQRDLGCKDGETATESFFLETSEGYSRHVVLAMLCQHGEARLTLIPWKAYK